MNARVFDPRPLLVGVGAREPESDELKCGWMVLGDGAYMRVTYAEPDAEKAVDVEEG